jgi:hypothetical protein
MSRQSEVDMYQSRSLLEIRLFKRSKATHTRITEVVAQEDSIEIVELDNNAMTEVFRGLVTELVITTLVKTSRNPSQDDAPEAELNDPCSRT